MVETTIFSTNGVGKLDMQKDQVGSLSHITERKLVQNGSKIWTQKLKTVKFREKLHNVNLAVITWIWDQKYRQDKKNKKLEFINIKNFWTPKNTIQKVKRQSTEYPEYIKEYIKYVKEYIKYPEYINNYKSTRKKYN